MAETSIVEERTLINELEIDCKQYEEFGCNYPQVAVLESRPNIPISCDNDEIIMTRRPISTILCNGTTNSLSSSPNSFIGNRIPFEIDNFSNSESIFDEKREYTTFDLEKSLTSENSNLPPVIDLSDGNNEVETVIDHLSVECELKQDENDRLLSNSTSEAQILFNVDEFQNNLNVNIYYDVPLEEVSMESDTFSENIPILSKSSSKHNVCEQMLDNIDGFQKSSDIESEDSLLSELECELETIVPASKSFTLPNGLNHKLDIHNHPEFKNLMTEYLNMQAQMDQHNEELERLLNETSRQRKKLTDVCKQRDIYKQQLENDTSTTIEHIYQAQIDELEKTIDSQEKELQFVKDRLTSHDAIAKQTVVTLQKDLSTKLEQVTRLYENCLKDRDSAVMKFAISEKTIIDLRKEKEQIEFKIREQLKEKELMLNKMRNMKADIIKLNCNLETKSSESNTLQREYDKLKEELSSKDIKIKWAQNKLRSELDSHKETKVKLEKTLLKLKEKQEEAEQVRRDCQQIVRTYQDSEEIKSNSLDIQLKEKLTELQMQKQEKCDQEEIYQLMTKELEALKNKHKDNLEEIESLKLKIKCFGNEQSESDKVIGRYKDTLNNQKKEISGLQSQIDELKSFKEELVNKQDKYEGIKSELKDIHDINIDLQCEADHCRKREAELLEFTERITVKNVQLQSEFSALESKDDTSEKGLCGSVKVKLLEDENCKLNQMYTHLEKQNKDLHLKLEEEQRLRQQESNELSRKLDDKIKSVEDLTIKLQEECNENKVLRRKHTTALKDLTRQLQQARKRLEALETGQSVDRESLSLGSRTSSNGSLDIIGNNQAVQSSNSMQNNSCSTTPPNESLAQDSSSAVIIVDKTVLLERIVSLQKASARKSEKIEFLEEHISQLVEELQKKTKIIQKIMISKEPGTLAPEVKAQLAKRGGIMASVYSSHPSDDALTLDLSLEINRKLQTVLEDTLLKNFTLKENLETLGEEIAKMSQENRRLQLEKQKLQP